MKNWWNKRRLRRIGTVIRFLVVMFILLQQYWLVLRVKDYMPLESKVDVSDPNTIFQDQSRIFEQSRRADRRREAKLAVGTKNGTMTGPSAPTTTPEVDRKSSSIETMNGRFLIFRHIFSGQGAGNVVSGLLAAQLLALEFNRTLCVDYPSFREAFHYSWRWQEDICQYIIDETYPTNKSNILKRNNYDLSGFSSECALRKRLESNNETVLYFTGNTYPRWSDYHNYPRNATDLFHEHFRPSAALRQILPRKESQRTVVHLRQADSTLDARAGLDNATLQALGEALPRKTYLVTNGVAWYDIFARQYGWSHPPWYQVQHSALHFSWGNRGSADSHVGLKTTVQNLQLWADWYTMLQATIIYHTSSDFSRSAARWNPKIQSWTIRGVSNVTNGEGDQKLRLDLERDLIEDVGTLPLSQRREEEMKFCEVTRAVPQEYKESRMASMLTMARRRREILASQTHR